MKYIKKFETGEWARNVDLKYVKKHPDNDSEEAGMIRWLHTELKEIKSNLNNKDIWKLIDIRGFDMYQGPYAMVKIFGKTYDVWTFDEDLWIEDFPVDNTSSDNSKSGFKGSTFEISDLLNEIDSAGGIEVFANIKKYNL